MPAASGSSGPPEAAGRPVAPSPSGAPGSAGRPGALFADGENRLLQRARELAHAYIDPRDRTESEVRARLQCKGIPEPVADRAIASLTEQRLIDDHRFAGLFVADKRALEQWGSERIRRGLLARGIDRELADIALQQAGEPPGGEPPDGAVVESELDRALALLRHRFPQPPQERRGRERALAVLLRKGYESELALDALAAYARGD